MYRAFLLLTAGLTGLSAVWPSGGMARDTKVVLLAGEKSHAPGEHEYEKSLSLFRYCLDTSLNVRHVMVELQTEGWPEDEKTLDDADTIVIFSDGGSSGNVHPLVSGNHMAALEKQMQRGCGLVVMHWTLNLPSKIGNETFLRWIGGFKDFENPPRPIGEPLLVQDWSKQADHPICRGQAFVLASIHDVLVRLCAAHVPSRHGFGVVCPFWVGAAWDRVDACDSGQDPPVAPGGSVHGPYGRASSVRTYAASIRRAGRYPGRDACGPLRRRDAEGKLRLRVSWPCTALRAARTTLSRL